MITSDLLDARDLALLNAILAGRSVVEAAAETGVPASTAYRRCRRPLFKAALVEARAAQWEPAARQLRGQVGASVSFLASVRDDTDAPIGLRVRAAERLVALAFAARETLEAAPIAGMLEQVLGALEDTGGAKGGDDDGD